MSHHSLINESLTAMDSALLAPGCALEAELGEVDLGVRLMG